LPVLYHPELDIETYGLGTCMHSAQRWKQNREKL